METLDQAADVCTFGDEAERGSESYLADNIIGHETSYQKTQFKSIEAEATGAENGAEEQEGNGRGGSSLHCPRSKIKLLARFGERLGDPDDPFIHPRVDQGLHFLDVGEAVLESK